MCCAVWLVDSFQLIGWLGFPSGNHESTNFDMVCNYIELQVSAPSDWPNGNVSRHTVFGQIDRFYRTRGNRWLRTRHEFKTARTHKQFFL